MVVSAVRPIEAPTSDGPWREWGGDGPVLHFAHANGLPPGTYKQLFSELLPGFRVVTTDARPLWPGAHLPERLDWRTLATDLRQKLEERGHRGIIGVGHSLGGVLTLLAAARDTSLFKAVVAIDPVVFTGTRALMWAAIRLFGMTHRFPLVRGALRRRERWDDLDQVRRAFASKHLFRAWADGVLEGYLEDGFVPHPDGGITLRYPKLWEAKIFESAPTSVWRALKTLKVPTLFIQGSESDTFLDSARRRALRQVPGAETFVVDGASHFVPMERPQEVAGAIRSFLQGID